MSGLEFLIHLAGFAGILLAAWLYHHLRREEDGVKGLGTGVCAAPKCPHPARYQDTRTGRCWCERHAISGGVR